MKVKALVLFSGGLDSILAVRILEEQGIEVTGLAFESYFFDSSEARKSAEEIGLDLIVEDMSEKQFAVVQSPKYGYGRALNPCIDCHGLMFNLAGNLAGLLNSDSLKKKKFDIIATGEVLGQRPFSQNKSALEKVKSIAGVDILRPLSAKLLPETEYEKRGLVQREKLWDISGKNRKKQLDLVQKYKIEYYPSPAGGCRLTESEFGVKVKTLLENDGQRRNLTKTDFELLRLGRHHWVNIGEGSRAHVVLGKNYEENERLKALAQPDDQLLEMKELIGPTALLIDMENLNDKEKGIVKEEAQRLILERGRDTKDRKVSEVLWRWDF